MSSNRVTLNLNHNRNAVFLEVNNNRCKFIGFPIIDWFLYNFIISICKAINQIDILKDFVIILPIFEEEYK